MTPELKRLVNEWKFEQKSFKRIEKRFLQYIQIFSDLNTEIYNQCQKEGIDIETLKLNL